MTYVPLPSNDVLIAAAARRTMMRLAVTLAPARTPRMIFKDEYSGYRQRRAADRATLLAHRP